MSKHVSNDETNDLMRRLILPCTTFLAVISVLLLCAGQLSAQPQQLSPKDTFATAGLSAKEIQEIAEAVEKSAYDTPESWTAELRARKVSLGNAPGLAVQGSNLLCGATGNCQTWIFRRLKQMWIPLFEGDQAPIAEGFELGPHITNGIKDCTIVANLSVNAASRVTYTFDGKVYRAK
jgi:hypothetical protein